MTTTSSSALGWLGIVLGINLLAIVIALGGIKQELRAAAQACTAQNAPETAP